MVYEPTSSSAITFADANRLEEWIHLFLCGEGNNKPFSDGLKREPRRYHAPKLTALNTLNRCCGPEDDMKWQIDEFNFIERVEKIIARHQKGDWDMPPLIVCHDGSTYELNDGNHRYEALKRMGIKEHWVILWEPHM